MDAIVRHLQKSLSYQEVQAIAGDKATKVEESRAINRYQTHLISEEKALEKEIETIWNHRSIDKAENVLAFDHVGLFSKESASIFGLSQKELIVTGASAGALGGLGIDALAGGSSLFLGSLIGGVVGGVGAMLGFDNLYHVKVLGQKFGRRELTIGPMQNLNFPYVLLGRALYYATILAKRSHALRDTLTLESETFYTEQIFDSERRKELEKVHSLLRKGEEVSEEMAKAYYKIIHQSFMELLTRI